MAKKQKQSTKVPSPTLRSLKAELREARKTIEALELQAKLLGQSRDGWEHSYHIAGDTLAAVTFLINAAQNVAVQEHGAESLRVANEQALIALCAIPRIIRKKFPSQA